MARVGRPGDHVAYRRGRSALGRALLYGRLEDEKPFNTVRRLCQAGLAHRDIKPANLLVRGGQLHLVDVFFTEVCPSPWRHGVGLANMLLVLGLRCEPSHVYERALRQFTMEELSEAFAATRGLTMPSQPRRMMRGQGRDLHAEFLRLLPEPPRPIAIQRFSPRRLGLTLAVLAGVFVAVGLVVSNLDGLGLVPA